MERMMKASRRAICPKCQGTSCHNGHVCKRCEQATANAEAERKILAAEDAAEALFKAAGGDITVSYDSEGRVSMSPEAAQCLIAKLTQLQKGA